jgi:hypothetical protein
VLTGLGEFDDTLRHNGVSGIVPVHKSKRYASLLKCDPHDTLGFGIEVVAVQEWGDWH